MSTQIIILAQGQQTRLPSLNGFPKQWLPLPACADTRILHRTLVQLHKLVDHMADAVTIIGGPVLRKHAQVCLKMPSYDTTVISGQPIRMNVMVCPRFHELDDPGNSSLKGASRALDAIRRDFAGHPTQPADRTVILLGDVIYSWKCLELLVDNTLKDVTVCGTSDLSASGGELWGLSWHRELDGWVRGALAVALEKHPPFTTYQPGQLRRWYWEMVKRNDAAMAYSATAPVCWYAVDDYTDDIDTPADLEQLPLTALNAAADDKTRGITWPL